MEAAARAANAHDFISVLPDGQLQLAGAIVDADFANVNGRAPSRPPYENILIPEAFCYPEYKESGWASRAGDVQNTFGDMDFDDRGYVYSAMTTHGWGVLRDAGETGASQLDTNEIGLAILGPLRELDVRADETPEHAIHVEHDGVQVYDLGLEDLLAAETD